MGPPSSGRGGPSCLAPLTPRLRGGVVLHAFNLSPPVFGAGWSISLHHQPPVFGAGWSFMPSASHPPSSGRGGPSCLQPLTPRLRGGVVYQPTSSTPRLRGGVVLHAFSLSPPVFGAGWSIRLHHQTPPAWRGSPHQHGDASPPPRVAAGGVAMPLPTGRGIPIFIKPCLPGGVAHINMATHHHPRA